MKVLISAAETSSDAHGAELLKALRAEDSAIEAFGIGGPKLREAGLRTVIDARELLAMGFGEIIGRLPKIIRALNRVSEIAERERPDVAVVIDYPDFHFRLARRLKALGIPVIYYIPPKVWAWRKGRIRLLRESFTKVLSILPFEIPFYKRENMPVQYVGNPLLDELPLSLTQAQARERLGLGADENVLLLMAGSRPAELKRHIPLMLETAERVAERLGVERLKVLMPFPTTSQLSEIEERIRQLKSSAPRLDIRVSQGDAAACMRAATVGIIKSGTSTLEAALMGCVHLITYKANPLSEWIFRFLIRYKGPIGLVNLVHGWQPGKPFLIREIITRELTVEALAQETLLLFQDADRRRRISEGLERVRAEILGDPSLHSLSPSARAAREVLSVGRGGAK